MTEASAGQGGATAPNDVETLAPEQGLRIGGELITVRPFGFIEGVGLSAVAAPIVNDLADWAEGGASDDGDSDDLGLLDHLFATHIDALVTLMALATGQTEAWVRGLDDASGQALLLTFWTVNRDFFTRRLLSRAVLRRHARARQSLSAH